MTTPRWPKWQTIDRAPKDGRDVLLCREGERELIIGWWSKDDKAWIDTGNGWTPLTLPPTHFIELPDAVGAPAVGEVA